jgi:hypothetical protein
VFHLPNIPPQGAPIPTSSEGVIEKPPIALFYYRSEIKREAFKLMQKSHTSRLNVNYFALPHNTGSNFI